jgi:hypothetical protein
METALAVIGANPSKVDGIKISLLDKDKEIAMRRRLPPASACTPATTSTIAELIAGDDVGSAPTHRHSDALLGIFDAIAPAASAALSELAAGRTARFTRSSRRRCRFRATSFRRRPASTRPASSSWRGLNGHQSHFTMVGGQQSARSLLHLAELFRLADAAGLIEQPDLAVARMQHLLALHGVDG